MNKPKECHDRASYRYLRDIHRLLREIVDASTINLARFFFLVCIYPFLVNPFYRLFQRRANLRTSKQNLR